MDIEKRIKRIEQEFAHLVDQKVDKKKINDIFFSKKSELSLLFKELKNIENNRKPAIGKALSELKKKIERYVESVAWGVGEKDDFFDVTEPGVEQVRGHLHPFTLLQADVTEIFSTMGFDILDGVHITTDYFNFESLNIPKGHPARDAWDTFYLKQKAIDSDDSLLLRPHTSAIQVPYMKNHTPPIRTVAIGRVFRNEATDATHEHTFGQIEGFVVDTDVSVRHLVYTLTEVLSALFDAKITVRLRPGYFPFVEPGYELDFKCLYCKGQGCRVCKNSGWVEFLGCGMIHPIVFNAAGYEPKKYTGFAFGMGFDRIAMMRYGVPEIRLFNSGDLRFVRQF